MAFSLDGAIGQGSHAILQTKFPLPMPQVCAELCNASQWSGELHHICKDGRKVIVDSRIQLLGGVETHRKKVSVLEQITRRAPSM